MSIAKELELIKLKLAQAEITDARVTDEALIVDLADGRTISVPILWFPRLAYGTLEERSNFQILRDSIHWPDLDEDIGLSTLLLGRGIGEIHNHCNDGWNKGKRRSRVPSSMRLQLTPPDRFLRWRGPRLHPAAPDRAVWARIEELRMSSGKPKNEAPGRCLGAFCVVNGHAFGIAD